MNKKPHNKKYYGENILSTLILFIDWFGGFTRENETQGENSFFFFATTIAKDKKKKTTFKAPTKH